MKRYFIALAPPPSALAPITEAQEALKTALPNAKWVDPAGAHLTLKFLGPVPEESASDIIAVLEESVRDMTSFNYAVRGIGGFPTPTRPGVIWAGVADDGETEELAGRVGRAMEWLGFKPENRAFHPHITLARIKNPRRLDNPNLLAETGSMLDVGGLAAKEVTLFESRLTPTGAIYTAVSLAALKSPD